MSECWINGARFSPQSFSWYLTGAEIRQLPSPPIRESDDLFMEVPGEDDMLVREDQLIHVDGRRFFTAPGFINAG